MKDRSYHRSEIDYSGGESPMIDPNAIGENEAYELLNVVWDQGRLTPRPAFTTRVTNTGGTIFDLWYGEFYEIIDGQFLTAEFTIICEQDPDTDEVFFSYVSGKVTDPLGAITFTPIAETAIVSGYKQKLEQVLILGATLRFVFFENHLFVVVDTHTNDSVRPFIIKWEGGVLTAGLADEMLENNPEEFNVYQAGGVNTLAEVALDQTEFEVTGSGAGTTTRWFSFKRPVAHVSVISSPTIPVGISATMEVSFYNREFFGFASARIGADSTGVYAKVSEVTLPAASEEVIYLYDHPMYRQISGSISGWDYGAGLDDTTDQVDVDSYVLKVVITTTGTGAWGYDFAFYFPPIQYATQDDAPKKAVVHNNRLFIASWNIVNQSGFNLPGSWNPSELEPFEDGGDRIHEMVSYRNALFVFKDELVYAMIGTGYLSYSKQVVHNIGGLKALVAEDAIWFLARNLFGAYDLFRSNGQAAIRVNRHVGSLEGLMLQRVDKWLALSGYLADPRSFRESPTSPAEGRISFFSTEGTPTMITDVFGEVGIADNKVLFIAAPNRASDQAASVPFTTKLKTHFITAGSSAFDKQIERVKFMLAPARAYQITVRADRGRFSGSGGQEASTTADTGNEVDPAQEYREVVQIEHTMPYWVDGKNVQFEIENSDGGYPRYYGYHFAFRRRKF